MNASANGSERATGGVNGDASVSVSASAEWTLTGSANEIESGSGSEGNENGRNVYGGGGDTRRARVRIHVLFAARSDRNRGRASDDYRDGNLGVSSCRLRHARPSFPSEKGEINWARRVGS